MSILQIPDGQVQLDYFLMSVKKIKNEYLPLLKSNKNISNLMVDDAIEYSSKMLDINNINYAGSFFILLVMGELTLKMQEALKDKSFNPEEISEEKFKRGEFSLQEASFVINKIVVIFFDDSMKVDFEKASQCKDFQDYLIFRENLKSSYPI